jgi:hypothetical protein
MEENPSIDAKLDNMKKEKFFAYVMKRGVINYLLLITADAGTL